MYKNRKKIIAVSISSIAVLAGFGLASWAIVDSASSRNIPREDRLTSTLSGATIYSNVPFSNNEISINDWMFYSMPKYAVPFQDSEDGFSQIGFYSDKFILGSETIGRNTKISFIDKRVLNNNATNLLYIIKYKNINENTYQEQVWTQPDKSNYPNGLKLVDSITTKKENNILISNNFYWNNFKSKENENSKMEENIFNKIGNEYVLKENGWSYTLNLDTNSFEIKSNKNIIKLKSENRGFGYKNSKQEVVDSQKETPDNEKQQQNLDKQTKLPAQETSKQESEESKIGTVSKQNDIKKISLLNKENTNTTILQEYSIQLTSSLLKGTGLIQTFRPFLGSTEENKAKNAEDKIIKNQIEKNKNTANPTQILRKKTRNYLNYYQIQYSIGQTIRNFDELKSRINLSKDNSTSFLSTGYKNSKTLGYIPRIEFFKNN